MAKVSFQSYTDTFQRSQTGEWGFLKKKSPVTKSPGVLALSLAVKTLVKISMSHAWVLGFYSPLQLLSPPSANEDPRTQPWWLK